MLHKMKWTIFPVLCSLLFAIPANSTTQMEPKGQILGGTLDAPVRIEVFSNFECTVCREYYLQTIRKVLKQYSDSDKVCVIYHDYPFQYHKYDRKAARYAEAASKISRDTLLKVFEAFYKNQADWSQTGELEKTLKKTLTPKEFDEILELSKDPKIEKLIDAQYRLAVENKLQSTPSSIFFYQGKEKKVSGLITYFMMKSFLDKILD